MSSQSLLDDTVYFTELTERRRVHGLSNMSLLDDTAEASGLSHMPIEYDSYVPGSAQVCSQEFMLCESYSGIVMAVLCYVPSRICDGHCSISCN